MKDYKAISEKQAELIEIFEDWLEIDYDDEGGYQKVRRLKSEIELFEKQVEEPEYKDRTNPTNVNPYDSKALKRTHPRSSGHGGRFH